MNINREILKYLPDIKLKSNKNKYTHSLSSNLSIPGNFLPSISAIEAPQSVETYENFQVKSKFFTAVIVQPPETILTTPFYKASTQV